MYLAEGLLKLFAGDAIPHISVGPIQLLLQADHLFFSFTDLLEHFLIFQAQLSNCCLQLGALDLELLLLRET